VRTELSSGIDYGVLPAVDPDDIAEAIVKSVRSRAAEIAVPGFAGLAAATVPFIPESVVRVIRRVAHDDAAITRIDDSVRSRYLERILKQ